MTRPVLLLVASLFAVTGCSSDDSSANVADRAVEALCASVEQARAGDAQRALDTFRDRAHDSLHELAEMVEDRSVEARLLEAKARIENGADLSPRELREAFDRLVAATQNAADEADIDTPEGCSP